MWMDSYTLFDLKDQIVCLDSDRCASCPSSIFVASKIPQTEKDIHSLKHSVILRAIQLGNLLRSTVFLDTASKAPFAVLV